MAATPPAASALESSNGITTEYVLDERGALPTILGEVRSDGTTRLYAYGPEGFAAQMTFSAGSGQGVGGFLLPGLTGLGHADEVYDLWRYADELPGASRFADDAVRHVDEWVDGSKLLDNTDDAGRFVDDVEKNLDCLINSFSADTPVMRDAGAVPISQVAVGDRVLAYNEATGATDYYTVTAVIVHIDPKPPRTDHRRRSFGKLRNLDAPNHGGASRLCCGECAVVGNR